MPAILPGIPDAEVPAVDFSSIGFPCASKYISLLAEAGAASR